MLPTFQRKAVELRVEVVLLVIQNPYFIADLQKPVQFTLVERCQVSIIKKVQLNIPDKAQYTVSIF